MGVLLLLAGLYVLPDAADLPAPDEARRARIEKALLALRQGEGEAVDQAVRDLALVGEVALPAIVRRLNEAEAGERLLLLAAVRRLPRAAPLLEQARSDPHPALRAWAQGPPRPPPPALRLLAARYLDLLAIADHKLRDEAGEDLKRLGDPLGRPPATLELIRKRTLDERVSFAIQRERGQVAEEFALAGAEALRSGALAPDLADPVFVAYLGLLREENVYYALTALVGLGERVAPCLEELLRRPNHDPRKIARMLVTVRADGGRGLYGALADYRPDARRALVVLAPDVLAGEELVALLEHAAVEEDGTVRSAALDALLELPAPAGAQAARELLDPARFGPTEFGRAAELLARARILDPLEQFASVAPPEDHSEEMQQLRSARAAAQGALRRSDGAEVETIGERLLRSPSRTVRTLGIDLVRDARRLLDHARAEPEEALAKAAILRVLRLHGAEAGREALDLLLARGFPVHALELRALVACGRVDLVVELAAGEERNARAALQVLADLPRLDASHAGALLDVHARAEDARKRAPLAALVPLATEEARARLVEAGEEGLSVLSGRALAGGAIPFAYPLRRFLEGADAERLQTIARVAEAVAEPEPGLFHDLLRAWDALPPGERVGEGLDAGAHHEKGKLLEALARSRDAESARRVFDDVVDGRLAEPTLVLPALQASARHLPAEQLARLVPLVRAQAVAERPDAERRRPTFSVLRRNLLRGSIHALAWGRVEAALDDLCDLVLDPTLHAPAYDWKTYSDVPEWAREALRLFPAASVDGAFRRALARAEADGRLPAMDPKLLFVHLRACRTDGIDRGRRLDEVALALCEVLDRLPYECETSYERTLALGGLARYAEAAAAARVDAAGKRARGYTERDGYWTAERMEGRAAMYDALAAADAARLAAVAGALEDPYLLNLAAWYLRFSLPDVAAAARAAERAVRATAGLYYPFRDTLAAVRNAQGRPADALRLLDPHRVLPVKRPLDTRWSLVFLAHAHLLQGDELAARHALEMALTEDRRILPQVRNDPVFARFGEVFRQAEEDFFWSLFVSEYPD